MKKKALCILLDTDQCNSNIALHNNKLVIGTGPFVVSPNWTPKHLYFTSDEEPEKDEWCIQLGFSRLEQWINPNGLDKSLRRKVIATTNPELWYKGPFNEALQRKTYGDVPRIGDDFVEAYIKAYNEGHPITEVMLEYWDWFKNGYDGTIVNKHVKTRSNGTVIISPVFEKMYTREEVYKMFTTLSYEMAQQILGNRGRIPIVPHEWFEANYPQ